MLALGPCFGFGKQEPIDISAEPTFGYNRILRRAPGLAGQNPNVPLSHVAPLPLATKALKWGGGADALLMSASPAPKASASALMLHSLLS